MITIKNYIRAKTLEEAWQLNQSRSNRVLGGMLWLRLSRGNVNTAIDLCDLGLNTIEEDEAQFSIGAMTTLRDLEMHEGLNAYSNHAVANALKDIVGVQFRNMATVGGSIWGRFGFSDVLTVFLAMDSYVELYKGGTIPLEQFATMLALGVSCIDGAYRASIGARPSRAMVVRDERGILKDGITAESARAFAAYAAEKAPTGSNVRGSAAYRTHLIQVLAERSLLELGGI